MIKEYKEGKCKTCGTIEIMPPNQWMKKTFRCKKCMNSLQKEWRDNNIDKARIIGNKAQRNLRKKILEHYSGKIPAECIQCGENRYQCLELDHINDDGAEHGRRLCKGTEHRAYRGVNSYIYRDIKKNNYPSGYQTLCANCHSIKTKGIHYGSKEYFEGK